MDKCIREKEYLYELNILISDELNESFRSVDTGRESYFVPQEERNYIMEYYFETVPQLKERLNELWKDDSYMQDIIKTVVVAAMKNKPLKSNQESVETEKDKEKQNQNHMPAFIYNF